MIYEKGLSKVYEQSRKQYLKEMREHDAAARRDIARKERRVEREKEEAAERAHAKLREAQKEREFWEEKRRDYSQRQKQVFEQFKWCIFGSSDPQSIHAYDYQIDMYPMLELDNFIKLLEFYKSEIDSQSPTQKQIWLNKLLYVAVMGGLSHIEKIAEYKPDLTARDSCGRSPLHYAASAGRLGSLLWLVKQNVDINAVDNDGCTALQMALKKWDIYQDKLVLPAIAAIIDCDKKIDLQTLSSQVKSSRLFLDGLLDVAYRNGLEDTFNRLLAVGADPDQVKERENLSAREDRKPEVFLMQAKVKKKLKEYSTQQVKLSKSGCCFWVCGANKSQVKNADAADVLLRYMESEKKQDLEEVMPWIQQDEKLGALYGDVDSCIRFKRNVR